MAFKRILVFEILMDFHLVSFACYSLVEETSNFEVHSLSLKIVSLLSDDVLLNVILSPACYLLWTD